MLKNVPTPMRMKEKILSLFKLSLFFLCRILRRQIFLLLIFFFASFFAKGQTTITTDDFENALTVFSQTTGTGTFYSGNSNPADKPATSPFAASNTYGYGISNGTVAITSSNINTFGYTSLQLSLKVAAFSIATSSNGVDNPDFIQIEISPDGGNTYYNTVKVTGNSNANWSYSATGNANTPYVASTTPVTFQPAGGGSRTTDGYSAITITSLPAV